VNLKQITLIPASGPNLVIGSVVYTDGAPAGYTIDTLELDAAPRRIYRYDLALVPGAVVAPGQLGARDVRVAGTIVGADAEAVRTLRTTLIRTVNNGTGGTVGIRWTTEGTTRQLEGHLEGSVVTRSTGSHFLEYEFTVVCPNPIAYSTSVSSGTWGDPLPLVNTGTATSWPEIVVTATGTSVTVANATTGDSMTVAPVVVGNVITVVTEPGYEQVSIAGVPVLNKVSPTSRFPRLASGNNTTTITGGTATVTWFAGWGE
jgi:hypothetical protein